MSHWVISSAYLCLNKITSRLIWAVAHRRSRVVEPAVGHCDPEGRIDLAGLVEGKLIGGSPRPADFAWRLAAPEGMLACRGVLLLRVGETAARSRPDDHELDPSVRCQRI